VFNFFTTLSFNFWDEPEEFQNRLPSASVNFETDDQVRPGSRLWFLNVVISWNENYRLPYLCYGLVMRIFSKFGITGRIKLDWLEHTFVFSQGRTPVRLPAFPRQSWNWKWGFLTCALPTLFFFSFPIYFWVCHKGFLDPTHPRIRQEWKEGKGKPGSHSRDLSRIFSSWFPLLTPESIKETRENRLWGKGEGMIHFFI